MKIPELTVSFALPTRAIRTAAHFIQDHILTMVCAILVLVSISQFLMYYHNGLGLAYNDARSHLDIGRRVVEGLKPGLAQLGSVWLPLPHILMVPTIWNDFMWHTGLSGALVSMISFVATGVLVYKILEKLEVGIVGRVFGVLVFAANINILYLQSTAMTELLLIATMTAGVYELICYHKDDQLLSLIKASFWVMLSTLIRYDGWFLLLYSSFLVVLHSLRRKKWAEAEGMFFLFCTIAGFGIFLWVLWNAAIFKDPLYFALGPYSAHAQQAELIKAGVLITYHNWSQSIRTYWYAMLYNTGAFTVVLGIIGSLFLAFDKKIKEPMKLATSALLMPLVFNILALYFGHSVLFVQGLNGNSWFNIRYGIMMMPSIAVLVGYLVGRIKNYRAVIIGLFLFVTFFSFVSGDAVTIDDGRVGSSQKNVSEVSGWLSVHAKNEKGFILISAASHDAIIFSSGLPMARFIHEGTGTYWTSATTAPDRWARWIVMRTNDENDQTFKLIKKSGQLYKYDLVNSYPFADIYQLKAKYLPNLITEPVLPNQR